MTRTVKAQLEIGALNPRVGVSMGVTVKIADFTYIKPSLYLEVDVPEGSTAMEAIDELDELLDERLAQMVEDMEERWE